MKKIATILTVGIALAQLQTVAGQDDSRVRGHQDDRQGDRTAPTPAGTIAPAQAPTNTIDPPAPRTTP